MKHHHLRTLFSCSLFTVSSLFSSAQEITKVFLQHKIGPIFSYTKRFQDEYAHMASPDSTFKLIDSYTLLGGNYQDKSCQFTIAVNTSQGLMGNGNEVYITSYKNDSAYVMGVGNKGVTPNSPFYIEACGHEYEATLNLDNKVVSIKPYTGKYVVTYILLSNNRVPDSSFNLTNGKKVSFKDYMHMHKYIYVMNCDTQPESLKELDALKKVTKEYNKYLTSVLIAAPDNSLLKPIELKEWIIADYGTFPLRQLQVNFYPNGALFDENGNIVNRGILPSELSKVLEKLENKK